MSVYNRKLFFNRGGQVNARGTGITSGLAQPVQKFQEGGTVDPMNQYRQAVYAGLMSGKSKSPGPVGSFLDVLGQSLGAANPLLPTQDTTKDDETYWAYNTSTSTYDRVTDETFKPGIHTKDAPKDPDKSDDKKEFEKIDILKVDDKGGYTIPSTAYRFANVTDESINHVGLDGLNLDAKNFIYASDEEKETSKWKLDNDFKVMMKDGTGEKNITRTWDQTSNKFKFLDQDNVEVDGALFDFIDNPDEGIDSRWKSKRVDLVSKTDGKDTKQAMRSYDEATKNFVYEDLQGKEIDMANYNEYKKPDDVKNEASKAQVEGTIQFKGEKEPKKADFIQDGNNVYYLSKGENGTVIGSPVLLSEFGDNLLDYDLKEKQIVETSADRIAALKAEKDLDLTYDMVAPVLKDLVSKAAGNRKKLKDSKIYRASVDNATDGSFAEQRSAFMLLLDTFGYKNIDPEGYSKIGDILNTGGIASTELVNAFFKNNVLLDALDWSQQLNKSELGLLFEKGPQIYLSKPGQMLLAETNIANAQIEADAADFIRKNMGTMDNIKMWKEVDQMMTDAYANFMERPEIVKAMKAVKDYDTLGDDTFFRNLGKYELKSGAVIDGVQAYKNDRIIFAGYANSEGIFIAEDGSEHDFSAFPNKPIYYAIPTKEEWEDSGSKGKIQAAITQFQGLL